MAKLNHVKKFLFKFFCVISLGIVYLIRRWSMLMRTYEYDETESMEEADTIIISF